MNVSKDRVGGYGVNRWARQTIERRAGLHFSANSALMREIAWGWGMSEGSDKNSVDTSVSVAITETGIEAKAKSRFIAAVDRLLGSFADWGTAQIEARTELRKAKTKGETQLIEAITEYGVQKLGADPAYTERAFDRHFRKVLGDQQNLDAVVHEAAEQLRLNPPSEAESHDEKELTEEFLDRFEAYASGATTVQLRQRWGRVLASEIRKPGIFSLKVLRIIDELDAEVAARFENFVKDAVDGVVPTCLSGELPYMKVRSLVNAGLIEDPGFEGQIRMFRNLPTEQGERQFVLPFTCGAIALPADGTIKRAGFTLPEKTASIVSHGNEGIAVPAYLLTDVGYAVASILPKDSEGVLRRLFDAIANEVSDLFDARWIKLYLGDNDSGLHLAAHADLPLTGR